MNTLSVQVTDTAGKGTAVVQLEGCGGIICTVDENPGGPGWDTNRVKTSPVCLMIGTDQMLILALAVVLRTAKEKVGFEGVSAAIEIARGLHAEVSMTMDDLGEFTEDEPPHG